MLNQKMKEFEEKISLWGNSFKEITWSNTINSYAENLTKTNIILNNILTEDEYFKDFKSDILNLQKEITKYIGEASNPQYQIAIVGAIKAGKSTLINSLIGCDLASVDVTPETATLTKLKSAEKSYVKTSFYSREDWNEIWSQANSLNKKADIFLREYDEVKADTVKENYLGKKDHLFESEDFSELKNEIKKWTSSKAKEHYFVKEIEIGLKTLALPKQICIVDTPGLNDVVEYRSKITLDYIDQANAVIVCVNAKTLRNEELVTIAKVFSQAIYKRDKIYVLGTQLDTLNSIEDWDKQKREWRKYLLSDEYYNSTELVENNLLGVSAYLYNILRADVPDSKTIAKYETMELINEYEAEELRTLKKSQNPADFKLSDSIKEKILRYSNIERVRNIVFKSLIEKHNESLLNDYINKYNILKNRIETFKGDKIKSLRELLEATKLNKDEIEIALAKKKKEVDDMKEKISRISTNVDNVTATFNFDFRELESKFNEIKDGIKNIKIE